MAVLASITPLGSLTSGEPVLSAEDIRRIRLELQDLVEAIGPRDAMGIVNLDYQQRHRIEAFIEWLEDAFGPNEMDE